MARVKVKVERGNGLQQVVTIDTQATRGARLGTDVYLPDGEVATPPTFRSWLGLSSTSGGSSSSSGGPSLSSVLTTKGDLVTRDSQVQRLGIGPEGRYLRSSSGLPAWAQIQYSEINDTPPQMLVQTDASKDWDADDFIKGLNIIRVRYAGAATVRLPTTLAVGRIIAVKAELGTALVTTYEA